MERFELTELRSQRQASAKRYLEFLRTDQLTAGLYELPAGGTDPQQPHTEDEVYYVARGKARIRVGAEDAPVGPGSIISVRAGVEHRFHDITEDLTVIAFFAPPEYSCAAPAT